MADGRRDERGAIPARALAALVLDEEARRHAAHGRPGGSTPTTS